VVGVKPTPEDNKAGSLWVGGGGGGYTIEVASGRGARQNGERQANTASEKNWGRRREIFN